MPHTNHNKTHNDNRAVRPENIHEDLQNRLSIITPDRRVEILNAEQETQDNEEAEDG